MLLGSITATTVVIILFVNVRAVFGVRSIFPVVVAVADIVVDGTPYDAPTATIAVILVEGVDDTIAVILVKGVDATIAVILVEGVQATATVASIMLFITITTITFADVDITSSIKLSAGIRITAVITAHISGLLPGP